MEPEWFIFAVLCLAAWIFAKSADKIMGALESIRVLLIQLERNNEASDLGTRLNALEHELYLVRRIAEEQTGITKEAVGQADRKNSDTKFKHLEEIIQKRAARADAEEK